MPRSHGAKNSQELCYHTFIPQLYPPSTVAYTVTSISKCSTARRNDVAECWLQNGCEQDSKHLHLHRGPFFEGFQTKNFMKKKSPVHPCSSKERIAGHVSPHASSNGPRGPPLRPCHHPSSASSAASLQAPPGFDSASHWAVSKALGGGV